MELVENRNGQAVTTSRKVAAKFGKLHKNVVRDITQLNCSEEFGRLNFELISYQDKFNRTYKEYVMTRDGFTFLVMGFTGKQAAAFKEEYIAAFNRMQNQLTKVYDDPIISMRVKQIEIEQRLALVEAQQTTRPEYFTIAGYARLVGRSVNYTAARKLGMSAAKICRERGLLPEPVTDPRFGKVNSYPKEVLDTVFHSLLEPGET